MAKRSEVTTDVEQMASVEEYLDELAQAKARAAELKAKLVAMGVKTTRAPRAPKAPARPRIEVVIEKQTKDPNKWLIQTLDARVEAREKAGQDWATAVGDVLAQYESILSAIHDRVESGEDREAVVESYKTKKAAFGRRAMESAVEASLN